MQMNLETSNILSRHCALHAEKIRSDLNSSVVSDPLKHRMIYYFECDEMCNARHLICLGKEANRLV